MREERKRRKMNIAIRELMRAERKLKPIEELALPLQVLDTIDTRRRPIVVLDEAEVDRRALLLKEWTVYTQTVHRRELNALHARQRAQTHALALLRHVDAVRYAHAVQLDTTLLPYAVDGPTLTPPIRQYHAPDGEYKDTTKQWL